MSGRSAELIGVGVIAALGLGRLVPRTRPRGSRAAARARRHARAAHARDPRPHGARARSTCSRSSVDLGVAPTWTSLGYALPIALVAFTGVEIVAGLLQEAANPARPLRRITIGAIAATVLAYVGHRRGRASPLLPVHRAPGTPSGYASDLSTIWGTAPLAGAAQAIGAQAFGVERRRRRARARERERDRRARRERRRSRSERRCARCARCRRWAACRRRSCADRAAARVEPWAIGVARRAERRR